MNIELAILLVLTSSQRSIPAGLIQAKLGQFTPDTPSLTDIDRICRALERTSPPEVKGTFNKDAGMLWKETDDGRQRLP